MSMEDEQLPLKRFPFSKTYYENYLKRLHSKNTTVFDSAMLNGEHGSPDQLVSNNNDTGHELPAQSQQRRRMGEIRIIVGNNGEMGFSSGGGGDDEDDDDVFNPFLRKAGRSRSSKKSDNFEVLENFATRFSDVGGYQPIKDELMQCVDLLQNYTKYAKFNVRVPKGLILEGPPGNGKTLIAKAFAGEAGVAFIPVSGSQFQEKYVGVGSTRIRELFQLANQHRPCIVFIDEIDALGRKRSGDGELSGSERDSTLNELLVQLDGFKSSNGIFVIGATNRLDLLDPALTRPGRIDKHIYLGAPDTATRQEILNIHLKGKPADPETVILDDLVEMTGGLSCAQIENLVNEAMLFALRTDREMMNSTDIETVMSRMMVGWQPTEHQFTTDILDHIAIHEMGHVVMGLLSKHHANVSKVLINLYSPQSPGYTVFEPATSSIYTREALFEHLMILVSGRIAEEVFYNVSVTTGAINDFEEALKLAEKMVVYYGMGKNVIYPHNSEKYKQMIDDEVLTLLNDAYVYAEFVIRHAKDFIAETAAMLKRDRILRAEELMHLLTTKYQDMMELLHMHG
jgi:cell division protease FtsH